VRTLDANTAVFEEGLRYVFAKNVAKARRDNKHVVGATDIAPQSVDRPIFWIVAGPNGSGKSTAYEDADIESFARSVWIINRDVLTARIRTVEGRQLQDANLEAVSRMEAWLEASIRAHQTVGVETVLSTDKYRRLVVAAKELHLR
jgi:ABC-type molybdenum transport system ATPase subunit/photorepair protein PhrA